MSTTPTHDSILIQVMADRSSLIRAMNGLIACQSSHVLRSEAAGETGVAERYGAARETLAAIRARNTAD